MCLAKPGPRCAHHTRQDVVIAKQRLLRARNEHGEESAQFIGAERVLAQRILEHDATSGGQDELRRGIEITVPQDRKVILQKRLERGISTHDRAMAEYKVAQRAAKLLESMKPKEVSPQSLPMKDMDAVMLTLAIREEISDLSHEDQKQVMDSIKLATYLHRYDTRKNATRNSNGEFNQPTSPYIEHPLRNTLRAARWGVKDAATLSAIALHDTVEDHHQDITKDLMKIDADEIGSAKSREVALSYIASLHGQECSDIVRSLSNPDLDPNRYSREEREIAYAHHVEEEVMSSPKVFIAKFSDLTDNALSAHHNLIDKKAYNRSRKYLSVCDVLVTASKHHDEELTNLLSVEGKKDMLKKVNGSRRYLLAIMKKYEDSQIQ